MDQGQTTQETTPAQTTGNLFEMDAAPTEAPSAQPKSFDFGDAPSNNTNNGGGGFDF